MDVPEDVPSLFVCPISLQIMRDPVTISTGMTFDRESIEKWLFSYKKTSCPVTKQTLSDFVLIPNSNLQRLIQSWRLNEHLSSQANLTGQAKSKEKDALTVPLNKILEEIRQPHLQVKSLRQIRSILVKENDIASTSRSCSRDDNLFLLVSSLIIDHLQGISESDETSLVIDEGMTVLCLLKPSNETLKHVSHDKDGFFIQSLSSIIIKYSSSQAKIQAATLLKSMFKVVDGIYMAGLCVEFFESLTEILKDQNSKQGTVVVLSILMEVLPDGKNKERAIKAGIIPVLVELLAEDNKERRLCEMMLVVLEKLCRKAEGREAFLAHPIGLAAVLSKVLKVSHLGNDKAIALFLSIFRFCKSSEVAQEFMEIGGLSRLWMLVQSGCSSRTKCKAREILGFHLKEWKRSPCFPPGFRDSDITWNL